MKRTLLGSVLVCLIGCGSAGGGGDEVEGFPVSMLVESLLGVLSEDHNVLVIRARGTGTAQTARCWRQPPPAYTDYDGNIVTTLDVVVEEVIAGSDLAAGAEIVVGVSRVGSWEEFRTDLLEKLRVHATMTGTYILNGGCSEPDAASSETVWECEDGRTIDSWWTVSDASFVEAQGDGWFSEQDVRLFLEWLRSSPQFPTCTEALEGFVSSTGSELPELATPCSEFGPVIKPQGCAPASWWTESD